MKSKKEIRLRDMDAFDLAYLMEKRGYDIGDAYVAEACHKMQNRPLA